MISRLDRLERDRSGVGASARIGSFFDLLDRLVDVPESRRREIRDELEGHVTERVRDLVLAGEGEEEAVERALSELGEASALARRFHRVHTEPRRRLYMQLGLIGLAGASLVVGVASIAWSAGHVESIRSVEPGTPPVLSRVPVVGNVFKSQPDEAGGPPQKGLSMSFVDTAMGEVLDGLGSLIRAADGRGARLIWPALDEVHDRGMPITLEVENVGIEQAIEAINDAVGASGAASIAWRAREGVVEIATRHHFDLVEREIVCYPLEDLIDTDRYPIVCVPTLLREMVEEESWVDSGGELGTIHQIGSALFIKAPPRMHEQVRWVLEQLRPEAKAGAVEGPALPGAQVLSLEHVIMNDQIVVQPRIISPEFRVVPLSYVDAPLMATVLVAIFGETGRVRVVVDAATNAVIVTAPPEEIGAIERAAHKIDRAFSQDD